MKKSYLLLILIIASHILLLTRLKFTAWPEMLLWPYLMIHGLMPYKEIAIVHTPQLLVDLALFYKLFGVGILQLQYFTWGLILITDTVLFWTAKKLWNTKTGIISVVFFAILSTVFDVNGLWFDLMLLPFSLFTYWLIKKKKFFWGGVIWTIMFFTKQTAFWFLIPIAIEIWRDRKNFKKGSLMFFYGLIFATTIFLFLIWIFKLLPSFYNWAISYGIFVLPRAQGQIQLPGIKSTLICVFPFLVFLPILFDKKRENVWLLPWALAGGMGAYPRFEYFHFLPAITFISLASGIAISSIPKSKLLRAINGFFIVGMVYLFAGSFIRNYGEGIRFYESDVKEISSYIESNTQKGDSIFVLNWWDNLYALTETLPATRPWVPQLEWYQNINGIQSGEVESLKQSQPKLIVFQPYSSAGLAAYKPIELYTFITANYHLKEKINGLEILIPNK